MWKFENIGLIFCLFFVLNCKKSEDKNVLKVKTELSENEYSKMFRFNEKTELIYDSTYFPNFKSNYKPIGESTKVDSMIRHQYKILYRGRNDKFFPEGKLAYDSLGQHPIFFDEIRVKNQYYPELDLDKISKSELFIFVDTVQIVKNPNNSKSEIKFGDQYAVYLINKSNLWHFEWMELLSITLIMEAYNKENKKWQPIEYQATHSGLINVLPPHSYLITSAIIYDGNYPTKLRLKYKQKSGMTYSNEFYGKINKSQFDTISEPKYSLQVFHY